MSSSLDLEVTRRCNLRCAYCFVGWSRDWISVMPPAIAHQINVPRTPKWRRVILMAAERAR